MGYNRELFPNITEGDFNIITSIGELDNITTPNEKLLICAGMSKEEVLQVLALGHTYTYPCKAHQINDTLIAALVAIESSEDFIAVLQTALTLIDCKPLEDLNDFIDSREGDVNASLKIGILQYRSCDKEVAFYRNKFLESVRDLPKLENYVLKDELPDLTNLVPKDSLPDMSRYILKDSVPDLADYVAKSELPDMSKYVPKEQVPDLSLYVLKSSLPDMSQFIPKAEVPDMSQFILKAQVPDLSLYVLKESVPDLSDYTHNKDVPDLRDFLSLEVIKENYTLNESLPDMTKYIKLADYDKLVNSTVSKELFERVALEKSNLESKNLLLERSLKDQAVPENTTADNLTLINDKVTLDVERVLYIREVSYCPHLKTLVTVFDMWINKNMKKRALTLYYDELGYSLVEKKYTKDKFQILRSSADIKEFGEGEKLVTDVLTVQFIRELVSVNKVECLLVVDRFQRNKELYSGEKVKSLYAASSYEDVQLLGLNSEYCIVNEEPKVGFNIPFDSSSESQYEARLRRITVMLRRGGLLDGDSGIAKLLDMKG